MSSAPIRLQIDEQVARVTLSRPERHNVLDRATRSALVQALDDLHGERRVRAVILTAEGPTFSAGADVAEMQADEQGTNPAADRFRDAAQWSQLFEKMLQFPKPLLAAVGGAAIAEGAGLVLACDIAVGSSRASFAFPETRLGLVAGVVAPLLAFRTGAGPAGYLLLSGRTATAEVALRHGLLQELAPDDTLLEHAAQLATDVARGAAEAVQLTKRVLNETIGEQLSTLFSAGAAISATARSTEAAAEGMSAFLEKRPPNWP